jgi:phospholipid/cholesterol/gamma-HCH transport system substrate-binding protein
MPRTRSLAWSELKIGIAGVVALGLLAFIVLAVGGEGGFFSKRYPLKTRFDDVLGLKAGAVVRLSGKEIGTVTTVEFAGPDEVEVAFEVLEDVRAFITTTSVAEIGSLSLLGEPIIDIKSARGGEPLPDHAFITSAPASGGFDALTSSVSTSLGQVDALLADVRAGRGTLGKLVTDEALYAEMQAFVGAAANVTRDLEAGRGTLGGLLKDPAAHASLKASLENLQVLTARMNSGQGALARLINDEAMGRSLSGTTTNLEQVSGRLARGEGTVGKLLTEQQLYDRLNGMTSRVDELVAGLSAGEGTAGQLLRDKQLYENMNGAVGELRDLLAEIRKDPRKYLRVNVSIF